MVTSSRVTSESLVNGHAESHQNPPYSPDLSPCEFFLFRKLKNQLREGQFSNDNKVLNALMLRERTLKNTLEPGSDYLAEGRAKKRL